MQIKRTSSHVTIGMLLLLLATPAFGQGPGGMQIFGLTDVSTYGGPQKPNEGYFFDFQGLYWSITPGDTHPVGFPGTRTVYYGIHPTGPTDTQSDARIQTNTLDTSLFNNQFRVGNRIEFGRIEGRNGWLVSIFQLRDEIQEYTADSADMVFNDPAFGPFGETLLYGNVNNDGSTTPPYTPAVFRELPVTFYNVLLEKKIDTWGVEANYMHRFLTRRAGGTFEMFLGARYFEFNEHLWVSTGADPGGHTVPSFLAGSTWNTDAENHIVGPQIGLRWFKKRGRWLFSTEGRFMAGLNRQNFHQKASLGPNLNPGPVSTEDGSYYRPFEPKAMGPTNATHSAYANEWSPMIELRMQAAFQVTRSISFQAGWSGMWVGGVARATSVVDYSLPALGLNLADNREDVILNGLTLGFTVNR